MKSSPFSVALPDEEDFAVLKTIANDLGQAAVSGNLSRSIGFNVSSMGVIPPPPPSTDPSWNEVSLAPQLLSHIPTPTRGWFFKLQRRTADVISRDAPLTFDLSLPSGGHHGGDAGGAQGELRVQRVQPAGDRGAGGRGVRGAAGAAAQSHGRG